MRFYILFLILFVSYFSHAQDDVLPRFPSLSSDGSSLAFSWQGDVWVHNFNTGVNTRMTVNESYDSYPIWSPDDQMILFTTNRYGRSDIIAINTESLKLERKTYHATSDNNPSVDEKGNIYFNSSRAYKQVEREPEIMILKPDNATPYRFLDALGSEPVVSPDGVWIALVKGNCRIAREQYRGPANRDLWLYNTQTEKYIQVTKDIGQDAHPIWTENGKLYFMSARSGVYNVYSVKVTSSGPTDIEQITSFEEDGIRDFSISRNGTTIVVERKDKFQKIDPRTETITDISFSLPGDYQFAENEFANLKGKISNYALSPDEKYIALEARGDIYIARNDKDNPRSNAVISHSWKDYNPVWNTDSTLLFISDRNRQEDIFQVVADDRDNKTLYQSFSFKTDGVIETMEHRELSMHLSPDQSRLAIIRDEGTLIVYDVDSMGALNNPATILEGWAAPNDIAWSPDNKWLAYSQSDLDFNREVYIVKADGESTPINISMHPRSDRDPVWSRDGSKIAFISNRNNGDDDIWFAWLKIDDWEKSKQDWKEKPFYEEKKKEKKSTDSTDVESKDLEIDVDNIYRRVSQVTSLPGDESSVIFGPKGETLYFNGKAGNKSKLYSVKWDGSEIKTIADHSLSRTHLSQDGKKIYYISKGQLKVFNIAKKKSETIPFEAKKMIDHKAERAQVFEEMWRVLNDRFYDPEFHGQDWNQLKEKYEPWAMKASTAQDFRDITNAMLGQLNASHMGLYGSNPEETQSTATGILGVAVSPSKNGITVTHVVPKSPADRTDSKLMIGDIILAVDGTPINNNVNFWSFLIQKENEKVWLEIERDGNKKNVYIRTTSSIQSELYDEWVEQRRQLTNRYSDGRLGYIHIQGMNWPSFERFERELTSSGSGKDGLVIDVRYNGGGWTTDMLMTVLMVRQHSYTVPRGATSSLENHKKFSDYYPYGERLPLSAWTKPAATICNHASYSNAEIFSHAFKTLNRGPLVGEPTFGAVISTGGHRLMDGSFVRLPFRAWYVKATGENMETTPASPDYFILNPPGLKAQGEDFQLKKAVEVLLDTMKNE